MHAYERSYPLKYNSANSSGPIIESNNTTDYTDPAGQIFATVGTGGESAYTFSSKDPAFVTQTTNTFGFLNIDMLNDGKTLKVTFFGNDGSTEKTNLLFRKVAILLLLIITSPALLVVVLRKAEMLQLL